MDDCIILSQKHIPEGKFQSCIDLVSYHQFVIDEIMYIKVSQHCKIKNLRACWTAEQSTFITLFRTLLPPVFAETKDYCDNKDPLSGLKNSDDFNPPD